MDKEYLSLVDEYSFKLQQVYSIRENLDNLSVACDVIYQYNFDDAAKERVRELLDKEEYLNDSLNKELDEIKDRMNEYRKNCNHEYNFKCSGGHRDIFECIKCGNTIRY